MVETEITVQSVTTAGLAATMAAANADGSYWDGTGQEIIKLTNGHASNDYTVTIHAQSNCEYGYEHDVTHSVVHGTTEYIGTFARKRFEDASNHVHVTYSGVTTLTVAVLKI